ncbi:hypothetical protein R6Z07F_020013 [Ovis aries]
MASCSGSKADFIIGGRYKLVRKIGSGSVGDIYLAINITNREEVAVKLESQRVTQSQLLYKSELYNILQGEKHGIEILQFIVIVKASFHNDIREELFLVSF